MKSSEFSEGYPGRLEPTLEGVLAFVPDELPPAISLGRETQDVHDEALLAIGDFRSIAPSLPNPTLATSPFLKREAVLSSRIEGTRTTIEQLYLFESANPDADQGTEATEDAREVSNYVKALNYGLSQIDTLPIANRLIREMHEILMDGVRGRDKNPGEFRVLQNYLGTSTLEAARFVPPPPQSVSRLMADFEEFVNLAGDSLPKLVRIAIAHYQFEMIHPFLDGNGRLGRLLVSLMLKQYGIMPDPILYLSAYFESKREEYIQHLYNVSVHGEWEQWLLFFLTGVSSVAHDGACRIRDLVNLRESFRERLQKKRAGGMLALADALFSTPVITIPMAQRVLSMTYRGAAGNVERLVEHEILSELRIDDRFRYFVCKPVLEILKA